MSIFPSQHGTSCGYKRTEAGIIPDDWEAKALGPHVSIISGESPSLFKFGAAGTPYFKVDQLNNSNKYMGNRETKYFVVGPCKTVSRGSVIFPKRGASIMLNKIRLLGEEGYMDSNMMALTPLSDLVDEYLYYALSHIQLWTIADVASIPQINNKHIKPLVVPVPNAPEQRAIAEALSDVDRLVESLDKLIAKKRAIKQAAMQQLLTGKTRLPEFDRHLRYKQSDLGPIPQDWSLKPLREDVMLLSGHHVLAHHCNKRGVGVPYLTGPADYPDGLIRQTKFTDRPTTLCQPGDILVTVKGSGSGTLVEADACYCISRQLMAIRVREWDSKFLFYSLLQNASRIKAASTGLIPGLSRSDILDQEIPMPLTSSEQRAIATVLSDMDTEIMALARRRDKTKQIKQGMMQELLTGRIRLT